MQSRREALKSLTLGAVLLGQTGAFQKANALTLGDECELYAKKLADAMSKRHGGQWKIDLNHDAQFALVVPLPSVD